MVEVRLLGPVEVSAGGVLLRLGTPKQQVVLAMLAARPGQLIPVDELVDELWPSDPPASAVANARSYAANLRRLFDGVAETRGLLVRRGSGYELRVGPGDVDLLEFVAECQRLTAALAAGDARTAAALLARVEQRWRGPALAGLPCGPVLAARRDAVTELRLGLVEQRAELHLVSGEPWSAVALLRDHLRTHPLRERGHALLMRALYQSGDVPGALTAFGVARSALVGELGIEPGAELRQLHQAVLNRDPTLERPARPDAPLVSGQPGSPAEQVPALNGQSEPVPACWLPRPLADFTGRAGTVRRLVAEVERADPTVAMVRMIDGMAGIGKTALAVHVATRLTHRYPDGQLFVDLGGHSPDSQVAPATALVTLLRQLGVPAGRMPSEFEHRAALWRSELAGRRFILVLDNAGSSEQIEPLLPSAPGSLVLVTSRRRLLASDGVPPESLPLLGHEEAVELLARIVGSARAAAEPEAASLVVRRCGYLPLAIRLVGGRLANRPGWRVADLAERLSRAVPVIGELAAGDRSVAGAFALSYEPLTEPVQRMFRLLGLFPGEHVGLGAAAAMADLSLPEAESTMAELVDRHLVEEPTAGRFRLHDLLRDYARELSSSSDSPTERRSAITRILDYYLHATYARIRKMDHGFLASQLGLDQPFRPDLMSALEPANLDWLEVERPNLRSLIRHAAEGDHRGHAWRLARVAWRFYFVRGYVDDILDTHRHGLAAARALGDDLGISTICNYRAYAYLRSGDAQQALRDLQTAIELRERIGDPVGIIGSRNNIAVVHSQMGRLTEAIELFRHSLSDPRRTAGDAMAAQPSLGLSLMLLGRYDEALRVHRRHLYMAGVDRDTMNIGVGLANIGAVHSRRGQYRLAIRYLEASLTVRNRAGTPYGIPFALNELGTAWRELGRLDYAHQYCEAALSAARLRDDCYAEAAVLNNLGRTLAAGGRPTEAQRCFSEVLAFATRTQQPYEQGRALSGLADQLVSSDPDEARRHWERALAIFRRMGVPERFDVERRLRSLGAEPVAAGASTER